MGIINGSVILNLHKLKHKDVKKTVINFIEDNWGVNVELEIVTGNSQIMRNIVISVLDEYKLTYEIGRPLDINKGRIITQTI